jgi:hypothetical protein
LSDDVEGHFFCDFACGAVTLQIPSRAKFHDKVDIIGCCDHFIQFYDIGMLEFLHDVDFVIERLLEIAVRSDQLLVDFLDGYFSAFIAGGFVDFSEGALAQTMALINSIVPNLLDNVHTSNYKQLDSN